MKTKLLILAIVLIFTNSIFAQKEHYVWYFGDSAGVDFNPGSPVALTDGLLYTYEGCATISDANGNLMFYTDGTLVWDRNHNVMPNGDSLGGSNTSTQSAIIVPKPGNNLIYYIFTLGGQLSANKSFNYSFVDMSLNGGNGDVVLKNVLIDSLISEKLTAVRHANNNDIWVMVHGVNNNNFYCYHVNNSGISFSPVISSIGISILGTDIIGQMKFSPDGSKIAFAAYLSGSVSLFDFDNSTGIVSDEKFLPLYNEAYGIEFSVTGNYLYSTRFTAGTIYQWDISSDTASVINLTRQLIATSPSLGSLQLGPDRKIYVARNDKYFLGVINYPDSSGSSCNYVDTAVSLGVNRSRVGLPNFVTSYFLPTGININNPQQNQLTISPNPATDKINISFPPTTSENITTKIYSITGEVVFKQENKSAAPITNFQIPIFNMSNGIYFLSVQTGREMVTRKIVVNH
ncbi:MAG TPA: T9SS type A sorting domain-containing protein [Bacteroidia bacterium]|nr:T9SS type A sorting domain-containing protein [Bacteroidia bacterium]